MNLYLKAFAGLFFLPLACFAQLEWKPADSIIGKLPSGLHAFRSAGTYNGQPFIAWYVEADLDDPSLVFDTDTSSNRRLTPNQFYQRTGEPAIVVNATFFSFSTNRNLNLVMRGRRLLSYNAGSIKGKGPDSLQYRHPFASAIGIDKKGNADVAWTFTDSSMRRPYAIQLPLAPPVTERSKIDLTYAQSAVKHSAYGRQMKLKPWKMQTAVGGGPVLVQRGKVDIRNNEELKFTGKSINDKHPRTAIGYTRAGKLIILAVEGRNPGIASGATLTELAEIMVSLGCEEALNLDGGGSSCLLVNGRETIRPSDKGAQRAVPAVFMVGEKRR